MCIRDSAKTVSMPILSGLLGGNTKYIWLSASPVVIEIELADSRAGVMTGKGGGAEEFYSTDSSLQNVMLLADMVQIDPGLLNSYTRHLEYAGSLTYHFQTWSTIVHSLPGGAGGATQEFHVNQTRAFSKLDTVFVSFAKQEADGVATVGAAPDAVKDVTWFEGLNGTVPPAAGQECLTGNADRLECHLTLGPVRMPHFSPQRVCEHFFRYLQALGKHNSDVHAPGITMQQWRYNSMVISFDCEKAHAGSGAEWSGLSTRGGDILSFFCKHAPASAQRCYVTCHHTVIARVSKAGCDFQD